MPIKGIDTDNEEFSWVQSRAVGVASVQFSCCVGLIHDHCGILRSGCQATDRH